MSTVGIPLRAKCCSISAVPGWSSMPASAILIPCSAQVSANSAMMALDTSKLRKAHVFPLVIVSFKSREEPQSAACPAVHGMADDRERSPARRFSFRRAWGCCSEPVTLRRDRWNVLRSS